MFVEPSWMNFFFVVHKFRIPCDRSRENTVVTNFKRKKIRTRGDSGKNSHTFEGDSVPDLLERFTSANIVAPIGCPPFHRPFLFFSLYLSCLLTLNYSWRERPSATDQPTFIHDSFAASGMELSTLFPSSKEWIIFSLKRTRRNRFIDRKRKQIRCAIKPNFHRKSFRWLLFSFFPLTYYAERVSNILLFSKINFQNRVAFFDRFSMFVSILDRYTIIIAWKIFTFGHFSRRKIEEDRRRNSLNAIIMYAQCVAICMPPIYWPGSSFEDRDDDDDDATTRAKTPTTTIHS